MPRQRVQRSCCAQARTGAACAPPLTRHPCSPRQDCRPTVRAQSAARRCCLLQLRGSASGGGSAGAQPASTAVHATCLSGNLERVLGCLDRAGVFRLDELGRCPRAAGVVRRGWRHVRAGDPFATVGLAAGLSHVPFVFPSIIRRAAPCWCGCRGHAAVGWVGWPYLALHDAPHAAPNTARSASGAGMCLIPPLERPPGGSHGATKGTVEVSRRGARCSPPVTKIIGGRGFRWCRMSRIAF
jgi:hypothetical protein